MACLQVIERPVFPSAERAVSAGACLIYSVDRTHPVSLTTHEVFVADWTTEVRPAIGAPVVEQPRDAHEIFERG